MVSPRKATAADRTPGVQERLIATASDLFYREGVRAVGIQRVIDEAGIAKASLYAHFDSKDELIAACLDKRISEWRAHVEAHLAPTLDARAKLLAFFDLQVAWIRSPQFRGCPLQSVSSEIPDTDHPAKRVMAKHRKWLHDLIGMLAAEAGLEPQDAIVGALVVLYDGASAAALVDGDPDIALRARWAVERLIDSGRPASTRRATSRARPPSRR